MKVIVAIDSLKGSLSSLQAGAAAKAGILRAIPAATVSIKLGSAHCLTYVTQSFGGHQKIVWRSPKDCLAFANRLSGICPIIKEKEEKSEARSAEISPS